MVHLLAMMSTDVGLIVQQLPLFIQAVKKSLETIQIRNVFKIVPVLNHMLMNLLEDAIVPVQVGDMLLMPQRCVVSLLVFIHWMEVPIKLMVIMVNVFLIVRMDIGLILQLEPVLLIVIMHHIPTMITPLDLINVWELAQPLIILPIQAQMIVWRHVLLENMAMIIVYV